MPQFRLDEQRFYVYFRMTPECFDEILNMVKDEIRKSDTNYREARSQKNDLLLHSDSLPLVTPSIPLGIAFELALQQ
ncbi:unnamed protein product [Acanthoscelides obtectus]|uniref:Uncharacterized protein n=1 Tax=Acanthoscelides obtectus TaxID=200917 RepID=A0A9P0PGG8_ACAOB|nr:unnamed protein product [Acanthoscelides obtectus]CAK1626249.1 hypothetical protein AOBTE_LOCUS3714 [Acanthoscelides obtectus]